jgi:hypothetical protein
MCRVARVIAMAVAEKAPPHPLRRRVARRRSTKVRFSLVHGTNESEFGFTDIIGESATRQTFVWTGEDFVYL